MILIEAVEYWHDHPLMTAERSDESWAHFVERPRFGDDVSYRFAGLRLANGTHRDLVHAAIIIHRIRNNLLHGEKWSYGLRNQVAKFWSASHMLMLRMVMDRTQPFQE